LGTKLNDEDYGKVKTLSGDMRDTGDPV
jgi:hypothetical protein